MQGHGIETTVSHRKPKALIHQDRCWARNAHLYTTLNPGQKAGWIGQVPELRVVVQSRQEVSSHVLQRHCAVGRDVVGGDHLTGSPPNIAREEE
jgi:hypothetical protein